jgi:hypothetical protein
VSYVQEVGQLGRDEGMDKAWSNVVLPVRDTRHVEDNCFGVWLIWIALDSKEHCRHLLVQMFIDGFAEPCGSLQGKSHFCDVCRVMSCTKPTTFDRLVFLSGLMEQGMGHEFMMIKLGIY